MEVAMRCVSILIFIALVARTAGGGVTMFVKGQRKGTIAGADFATALFSIWLGSDPVDESLKAGLLGS
jgi:Chalcone isomerase-like